MTYYNFEGNYDWEFEDRGDTEWDERAWKGFLVRNRQEIELFLKYYRRAKAQNKGLEEVIKNMGWAIDLLEEEEFSQTPSAVYFDLSEFSSPPHEDIEEEKAFEPLSDDPYTIHKHPMFIASAAVSQYIQETWEAYLAQNPTDITPVLTWNLAQGLNEAKQNILLSIHAIEMGDYTLGICQLKLSLKAINDSFSTLNQIPNQNHLIKAISSAFFDIRDICLRVMRECREADDNDYLSDLE